MMEVTTGVDTTRVACITQFPIVAEAPPGCQIHELEPYANPFPTRDAELQVADLVVAAIGIQAARSGCDAVVVNTLADYGVDHMRRFLGGPVVGAGEAAYADACLVAERFAVVTVWPPSLRWLHELKLAASGMARRCVAVRFVAASDEVNSARDRRDLLTATRACDVKLVERTMRAIEHAVEEDGAQAIVLGCTCMSALASQLTDIPVPVINPEVAAIERAARLAARFGPVVEQEPSPVETVPTAELIVELGNLAARLLR